MQMGDDGSSGSQHSGWKGMRPDSRLRQVIAVATVSAVTAIGLYALVGYALSTESPYAGLMAGVISGLLTSGLIAAAGWFMYDLILPTRRHRAFPTKIEGAWFGYYPVEKDGEIVPFAEYIFLEQVAERLSGRITSQQNCIYDFFGHVSSNTVVVTWVSHQAEHGRTGAIALKAKAPGLWAGIQVAGHIGGGMCQMPYLMSRHPIEDTQWHALFGDRT